MTTAYYNNKISVYIGNYMGKHERDWVEIAEKAVTAGLNGKETNPYIKTIVDEIQNKLGLGYEKAEWVGGNDYKDPGDVHLIFLENKKLKIELKFSRNKGLGTAKNLGSNTFNKKINNTILGYSKYDEELGLKGKRWKLLSDKIGKDIKTNAQYCSELRILRDNYDPIIEEIDKITSPGQVNYASYAAEELNKFLPKVNDLVHSILGINNQIEESGKDVIYCVIENFETASQTVKFCDFEDMDRKVVQVINSGKSIKLQNKKGKDVLRFSVTWKNICQGGATPCFNVFIGSEYRSNTNE